MLLLLLASLCNQSRLFVSFPIPYFFLQEEKQVIPCPDLKLSQNFFKFMLSWDLPLGKTNQFDSKQAAQTEEKNKA